MLKQSKILLALVLTLIFSFPVYAASFQLTKIGALDTTGKTYPEWWYTGTNPTFSGTASAGTKITVKVNDISAEITANSSGAWSYKPAAMPIGDYYVSFTSTDGNYSFKLHITQTLPATFGSTVPQSTPAATVPDTGSNQLIMGTVALSLGLLGVYFLIDSRKRALQAFEKRSRDL